MSKNKQLSDDDLREAFKNGLRALEELNVSYSNITGKCFAEFKASGEKGFVTHRKRTYYATQWHCVA
jgi:hypothetical protein